MLHQNKLANKEKIMQDTVSDMAGYIAVRQEQIDALERKEKELMERIRRT